MNIDMIKNDIRSLEADIRELKTQLRTTWTRPMGHLQTRLLELKEEITELLILRAWARGRFHLQDIERCRDVSSRRMSEYQLEAA
jgi:hypothetical protein